MYGSFRVLHFHFELKQTEMRRSCCLEGSDVQKTLISYTVSLLPVHVTNLESFSQFFHFSLSVPSLVSFCVCAPETSQNAAAALNKGDTSHTCNRTSSP